MKIEQVTLLINQTKPHAQQTATALQEVLARFKVRQEWIETLPPGRNLYRRLGDQRTSKADLVIAVGGDGTLLQAAHRFRGSEIPVLGVNVGYLGFITSVEGAQVQRQMKRILQGDFVISHRTALDLTLRQKKRSLSGWALNDALIVRGDNPHLIGISARIGERCLTNYRCDGLIISTPTGSTAYSLAAGGPIISPECSVLTVTPICPQSLTNRSVVVNSTEVIEMTLDDASGPGMVQVDGMNLGRMTADSTITVRASSEPVPIAFLPEINYYDVLAEKLKWRGDGLNKPKYGHA